MAYEKPKPPTGPDHPLEGTELNETTQSVGDVSLEPIGDEDLGDVEERQEPL